NKYTFKLLQAEPFFASLSRRIQKRSSTAIPTAGVRLNKDTAQFEMLYNPQFFEDMSDKERLGVLKHEFYHIIFEHVTGRLPPEGMSKMWNVATDLAINSHLMGELPEGGCFPTVEPFQDYPLGMSAEWYFSKLQNDEQFKPKDGEGDGEGEGEGQGSGQPSDGQGESSSSGGGMPDTMDDHSGWGDASEEVREMAKERLKQAVEKAAQEAASGQGWGTVSAEMRKRIMDMIKPKVNWRSVLRYFIKTSQRADKRSTVKRYNKKYRTQRYAGKKVKRTAKIAVAIDQSGSVNDAMLAAFFTELNGLAKLAEFTVVPFDTQVDDSKVYVWKKGQRVAVERVLTGGTDFSAPTQWCNERKFDGLIILTDMEAPKPTPSKAQRLWLTTPECKERAYFQTNERVIAID
ncbi:MAG: vWA domain-containing protein, partial [Candidatus Thorarchaeota archaeon]